MRKTFTDEQIIETLRRYMKGETSRELAKELGTTYQVIHNWAKKVGVFKPKVKKVTDWVKIKEALLKEGEII